MNAPDQSAKLRRRGRDVVVTIPDGFELEGGAGVYRIDGREIVLHPNHAAPAIPPGYYTPETLPPLGEGARAILASIDAVAPFVNVRAETKDAREMPKVEIEEPGVAIDLSDKTLPGFDPDR